MAQFRPLPSDKKLMDHFRDNAKEKINKLQSFLDEPPAPSALTPMGMTRELVRKWHEEHFGLKIQEWKLEVLASRIADLMIANTLEAVRGLEDYNGKYQIAVMENDKMVGVLERHGFRRCDIAACNCGSWHPQRLSE